ncbi:MAG TPA: hypothetical protein PLO37_19780 [Candidatus Hydrogenedentes bacterium]|nr:hypothetical protein [Candidatus Hydrogenedentota bacterium]HPG69095.1 hypothetical protein [Candidatus Hydrogenedentota bacterium]
MVKRIAFICLVIGLAASWAQGQEAAAPAAPEVAPEAVSPAAQQVNVSVKIMEFQTTEGIETGLSAYFQQRNKHRAFGRVTSGNGAVVNADLTFPTDTAAGITVFLDRLRMSDGDLEIVLQALEDQNRAFILSRPKALVTVGSAVPTVVQTTQQIPYENTQVVGSTAVQITSFRDTGVSLTVSCPQVVDDDGDPFTRDDTYIQLSVMADVKEEGQRITVALDDMVAGGIFNQANNAIDVPEFVSRSVQTSVWVRHGQVLILGGLYRNTKSTSVSSLPWIGAAESKVMDGLSQVVSKELPANPLSSVLGNRSKGESRRELVFLIKAELWSHVRANLMATEFGFDDFEGPAEEVEAEDAAPSDVITNVVDEGVQESAEGSGEGGKH